MTPSDLASPPAKPQTRAALVALSTLLLSAGCGLEEIPRRSAVSPRPTETPGPEPSEPASGAPTTTTDPGSDPQAPPPPAEKPPPAEPGVTLDGRFVRRQDIVVFLHIGHSNMAGRATGPDELRPFFYDPHPRLFAYRQGGQFQPASEPLAPDDSTDGRAGPGMAILRWALEHGASPDTIFVSVGHGHSGTYGGNCRGFRREGLLYDLVMAPARELKGKVTFGGIFTMLGQSEHRATAEQQRQFAQCLAGVAREMREDLDEPELPFLVGDYERGINRDDIGPTTAFAQGIMAQIAMVPELVERSAVIATDGLPMEDTHHFDMEGHKGWAERGIQLLVQKDWAPWAKPPPP